MGALLVCHSSALKPDAPRSASTARARRRWSAHLGRADVGGLQPDLFSPPASALSAAAVRVRPRARRPPRPACRRREQAIAFHAHHGAEALLCEGGNVLDEAGAPFAGHGQQPQLAAAQVLQEVADEAEVGGPLPAQQVLQGRRGAAVGHVGQRNSRSLGEAKAEELGERASGGRCIAAAGLGWPSASDIVGQRAHLGRHRRADRQAQVDDASAATGTQVADRS